MVVIVDDPVSILPKPEVILPESRAPVVTIPVPPAIGLKRDVTLVPPIVIASASTVPSKNASLNSSASVPKSSIALVPGVSAPSVSISCFSLPA